MLAYNHFGIGALACANGQPFALNPTGNSGLPRSLGNTIYYDAGCEIYGEAEPVEYCYEILSGAVRSYNLMANGRRSISSFYLRGDFFGLEVGDTHMRSAQAITDCKVLLIKRKAVLEFAEHDAEISQRLWKMTCRELERARAHLLLLTKDARGRVATFLLDMLERSSNFHSIELPMSRRDIADYLGLTIETVSRSLTSLEREGIVGLPDIRHFILRNREALLRCCE